jgi:hypothetical protein
MESTSDLETTYFYAKNTIVASHLGTQEDKIVATCAHFKILKKDLDST